MTASKETQEVIKAARAASLMANREAKALGLVVRLIEKGIIYDKYPDGKKVKIGTITSMPSIKIEKGTVLQLKNE